ncbi:D-alanyl-D-alanine carboxypeptidase [Bradyrhizobium sp. AUGA SZCCT0283]|uniref:D-alanyl-D-alanine carboxypeptidase n=1 Tax=Bradyrhizobium sp. AUGA SZCCT0283 TaxID=2807671 RepID=UPI001BABDE1D|nr:D-alanyl-D-alanine carboxypeptidase [Bradyrhizobium sp. AUGA SZCCT0283]MBR1278154.1 D-alanyl-D-alanine carboxypeptidase [Bradyrhizobium sp. AUGA SZCCT0283]
MLRTTLASSRTLRVCALGLITFTTAILISSESAEARRYKHRRHHHVVRESYSPQFSSIIVDGNSGAVLSSNNPDGIRRPASLTKIMTLYLLFERLDAGKMKLDTEMEVSEHASEQAPTKLGLKPGQTLKVEDAIKGLVTRSANDAAVVIAEAIAGNEDEFARLMTRKARALGMSKTTYRNASGLPNDEQLTTARDQATLGRAIQDRYPRYYRYFATTVFNYRGQSIRNHNRLLGNVEGVDGIKTGYTRASGFNLVSSMRRGNRHLIGVVLGGRSGGSRDATMRNLLAENLEKGATKRTVAAITERNPADGTVDVAEAETASRPAETTQSGSALAEPGLAAMPVTRSIAPAKPSLMAAAAAALPPPPKVEQNKFESQAKPEPAPLTSGVIQTQQISAIPGSAEPMKPVKVKTVQVKAGPMKLAAAGPSQPVAPPITSAIPARPEVAETSSAVVANAAEAKAEAAREALRAAMPQQPAGHGTGNGVLGVLPASSLAQAHASHAQALAYADPAPRAQAQAVQQNDAVKPAAPAVVRTGWIVQVGALESESEAKQRIDLARTKASALLSKADPFTEPVVSKDNRTLFRARFAGLDRDQAEAVCRTLKRADISCMTVRN